MYYDYYGTLKRAIASGKYDRAYAAYIKKMNGETATQKMMIKVIRFLDTVGQEESKTDTCRGLF